MRKFNLEDIYGDDLSFKFPHGIFKALSEDDALFISDNNVLDLKWKINSHGFLILMFPKGRIERYLINETEEETFSLIPIKKNNETGKYKRLTPILVERFLEREFLPLKSGLMATIKDTHRSVFLLVLMSYILQFIVMIALNKFLSILDFSSSNILILSSIVFFVLIKNHFYIAKKIFTIKEDFFRKNL
jgi:hypothetical protein